MNLFAQVFQDLEDGLYAPFPEEEEFSRDETDTSEYDANKVTA